MKRETKIEFIDKNDIFFLDGKKYTVTLNENLSSSFNQLHTVCEGEECNLRLRKNETVWVEHQEKTSKNNRGSSNSTTNKIRNEKGNVVTVSFSDSITENKTPTTPDIKSKILRTVLKERKLSKGETESRDKCVKALMDTPRFVKKYKKMSNVHHPGRTIDDVAYGTCTDHAKGVKTKQREWEETKQREEEGKRKSKKKKTNESVERLDTIRKAIRRTSE
jgi:hypothetical protein